MLGSSLAPAGALALLLGSALPVLAAPPAPPAALGKVLLVQVGAETVVLENVQLRRLEDRAFLVGREVEDRPGRAAVPRPTWLALAEVKRLTEFDSVAQLRRHLTRAGPRVNERVEVEEGGVWWPAEILEVKGDQYHIHYTGWSPIFDAWMPLDRIRRPASP